MTGLDSSQQEALIESLYERIQELDVTYGQTTRVIKTCLDVIEEAAEKAAEQAAAESVVAMFSLQSQERLRRAAEEVVPEHMGCTTEGVVAAVRALIQMPADIDTHLTAVQRVYSNMERVRLAGQFRDLVAEGAFRDSDTVNAMVKIANALEKNTVKDLRGEV